MKIAVAGFQHETNCFQPEATDWRAFTTAGGWPALTLGGAVLDAVAGRNLAMAGFIAAAVRAKHAIAPLLWANAQPAGLVNDDCFERIAALIISELAAQLPVEAVYLDLHGAMVTRSLLDPETELLRRIRAIVGNAVPMVASFDWHANLSQPRLELLDFADSYRTYPHIDMAETGARVALELDRFWRQSWRSDSHTDSQRESEPPPPMEYRHLAKSMRKLPFLIPLTSQCSEAEPMAGLFAAREKIAAKFSVSLGFTPGFPPSDVPHLGATVYGYGEDARAVEAAVAELYQLACHSESDFAHQSVLSLAELKTELEAELETKNDSRPIIIADSQDNPGAGGGSDSTDLLRHLIEWGVKGVCLALWHDPQAAATAHQIGIGASFSGTVGGRCLRGDQPLAVSARVTALHQGDFIGTGAMWHGATMNLGKMARLDLYDDNDQPLEISVLIAEVRQQPSTQAIFRQLGVEPSEQKIIVLKSSVHFRADFQAIARKIMIVAARGVNLADPRKFPYRKINPSLRLAPALNSLTNE